MPPTDEKKTSAGFSLQFVALVVVVSSLLGACIAIFSSTIIGKSDDIATRTMNQALPNITNEGPNTPAIDSPTDGLKESDEGGVFQASFVAAENQRIAEQIGAALQAANFDGYSIDIVLTEGKATIDGRVTCEEERQKIGAICLSIPGVQSVDNKMTCDPNAGKMPMSVTP